VKLPDQGASASTFDDSKRRRMLMAGLVTSAQGALGSPSVSKPTLG